MTAIHVNNQRFDSEVLASPTPVLVDFWAPWCGPCRMLAPVIDEIATEYEGRVKVVKVNIDDDPELAQRYGVMSIPTLLLFQHGKITATSVGAKPKSAIVSMLP